MNNQERREPTEEKKTFHSVVDRLVHFIVWHGKTIGTAFAVLTLFSLICYPFVGVNYDMAEYLPSYAPTRQALTVMEDEFGYPGMARIMVRDCTMQEAQAIREKISKVEGVELVLSADLATNIYAQDDFLANKLTEQFYKDGNAVMEIIFEDGNNDHSTYRAIDEIYGIVGERGAFSGAAVAEKEKEASIQREVAFAIVVSVIIILAILLLTTNSYFEPLLFIMIMGIAIILNLGTNIIFGTISFFTFSTAAIFQLAVSIDYSIFLLHTYTAYKESGIEIHEAMKLAVKDAARSIFASGATTAVGFIVLVTMEFTVGADVGLVLTKGILCSLATVLLLMPTLIIRFNDIIDKTRHKPFFGSFDWLGKAMYHLRFVALILSLIVAVPCYFGQDMNAFYFGNEALGAGPGTKYYEDTQAINEVFGKSNIVLAIVPNDAGGSMVREKALVTELDDLPFVNFALSMGSVLPEGIPVDFLPQKLVKQMRTEDYSRIFISMDNSEESEYSFECSQELSERVKKAYPEDSYVIGMTPTVIDIRDILRADYSRVSILSLLGVALVVLCSFQCITVPILVILPIEVAIYLNMTIPYLQGQWVLYIGYIIVSCLQLGATIDYSILMTNNYLDARKTMGRKESAIHAISKSALSVMTSGLILMVVGYLLFFTSSMQSIKQIGELTGRGAMLSLGLVLSLLPALLATFDPLIQFAQGMSERRHAWLRAHLFHQKTPAALAAQSVQEEGSSHE